MKSILLRNARLVNKGVISETDILIVNGRFAKIQPRHYTVMRTLNWMLPVAWFCPGLLMIRYIFGSLD